MAVVHETKMRLRRRTVLAAAIVAIGLTGAMSVRADPVGLQVVNRETGQALRMWRHHGRLFVAGEPGARYGLRLTNHTDGRVLLVLSVDGVNVLTGETAAYDQRGYILNAYQGYDVDGWRKTTTEVAAFAFAPLPQSYAARTGRPSDVGVIGMAVFQERAAVQAQIQAPPPAAPVMRLEERRTHTGGASDTAVVRARRATAGNTARIGAPPPLFIKPAEAPRPPPPPVSRSAASAPAPQTEEKLGTAHGAREWSVVSVVPFERASRRPQWISQIEYDTYDNLVASGVIPPSPYAERRPRPFPLNPDGAGFVPDPPTDP